MTLNRHFPGHRHFGAVVGGICAFCLIAILVFSDSFLIRIDQFVARECYEYAIERPTVRAFFEYATAFGNGRTLNAVGTFSVVVLLLRREWIRALIYAIGQLSARSISSYLKGQFQRKRPEYVDWPDFSFPSGHAFGSALVYGLVAFMLVRIWAGSRLRLPLACCAIGFVLLIGLSRIMLGVHYMSDVLAGLSLGMAWGAAWEMFANRFDRNPGNRSEDAATT